MARELDANKRKGRSAVTNGTSLFLDGVDARAPIAKRYRDIVDEFGALVGGVPTIAQESLIRRVAALSVQCEQDECAMAAGQEFNGELYIRRANILGGLVARLGLAKAPNAGDSAKVIDQHTAALAEIDAPSRYHRP